MPELDDIRRADMAREVLDNALFNEAFDAMTRDLQLQRAAVKLSDAESHTRLIMAERLMTQLKTTLTRAIQDGEIAKWNVARERNHLERIFRR